MTTRREMLSWVASAASVGAAWPILLTGCEARNPLAQPALATPPAGATSPSSLAAGVATSSSAPLTPLIDQLTFRRSADRGHADHGWLKAKHSFSFSRYQDPRHMGFRALRVINEDVVSGGGGFPMHPHRDMEILTYILDGALEHKDSMGNGSIIRPGEVQTMSAGTGILHSEFNPSGSQSVHLLQIWLKPDRANHTPRYAQQAIPRPTEREPIRLIASRDGEAGSVMMHQDARIYAVMLRPGQEVYFEAKPGRHTWTQVARGTLTVNTHHTLYQGDGLSTSVEGGLLFGAAESSELLIFDLA